MNDILQIQILHAPTAADPFAVIYKPRSLPSAPLAEQDDSAFTQAAALFPELLTVDGRKQIEHGLLHRIDTVTEGILLIASTQQAYDFLLNAQETGAFTKWYTAKCDFIPNASSEAAGYPPPPAIPANDRLQAKTSCEMIVRSFFRPFGMHNAQVRPVTPHSGKAALLKATKQEYETRMTLTKNETVTALCRITKGYRHQVRCHLSWLGYPVHGDSLYNPNSEPQTPFCFTASSFSFPHPLTNELYSFSIKPDFLIT